MDISFIIVNWNTADLLKNAIRSIKNDYSFEIIVVDNASTDGSVGMLKKEFPDVFMIENSVNMGFAGAVNQGIGVAVGDYVILLNSDAVLGSESVERLISYMNENQDTGICGGQLINPDGSRQNSFDNFPSLATELLNKSLLRLFFPDKYPSKNIDYDTPLNVDSIIGACFVISKKCMQEVGLLDEDYFFFMEETDWCYRASKAGYKITFVPSAKITHLQGKSAEKIHIKSRVEYYYSRYLYFLKNRGKLSFAILLYLVFLRCFLKSIGYFVLALFTIPFNNKRMRDKLKLSLCLIVAHISFFPASMRMKGSK